MTWWIHLLVRRADMLRQRCDVLERVVLAMGLSKYCARCEPLLAGFSTRYSERVVRHTVNGILATPCDLPSYVYTWGALYWYRNGRFRKAFRMNCSADPDEVVLYSSVEPGGKLERTKEGAYELLLACKLRA
jgi:hypothetical protein